MIVSQSRVHATHTHTHTHTHTRPQFLADVELVWSNCFKYNQPGEDAYTMGQAAQALFNRLWGEACAKIGGTTAAAGGAPAQTILPQQQQVEQGAVPGQQRLGFPVPHGLAPQQLLDRQTQLVQQQQQQQQPDAATQELTHRLRTQLAATLSPQGQQQHQGQYQHQQQPPPQHQQHQQQAAAAQPSAAEAAQQQAMEYQAAQQQQLLQQLAQQQAQLAQQAQQQQQAVYMPGIGLVSQAPAGMMGWASQGGLPIMMMQQQQPQGGPQGGAPQGGMMLQRFMPQQLDGGPPLFMQQMPQGGHVQVLQPGVGQGPFIIPGQQGRQQGFTLQGQQQHYDYEYGGQQQQ